jgi:Flp pilus assembly pilin Flp
MLAPTRRFTKAETAATSLEYGLVAAGIAIAAGIAVAEVSVTHMIARELQR